MPRRVAKNLLAGARRLPTFALGVLTLSLALSVGVTYLFARSAAERDQERFHNVVQSTRHRIDSRLNAYVGALLATRGLFAVDEPVTPAEFRQFVTSLELQRHYPGIQGIGFSIRLEPEDREPLERRMRHLGQHGFAVWPAHPRAEWHTIAYLEPLDRRNREALGYDMFTQPVRRKAMSRARDTGRPAASGRVTLVQEVDPQKQPGFLIYVPVYDGPGIPETVPERRKRLVGFVYAAFRMGDLLAGIFGSEERPNIAFEIYEGTPTSGRALYRSDDHGAMAAARLTQDTTLEVAGLTWVVRVFSKPSFENGSSQRFVPYVLGVGFLASIILFVFALARSRVNEALRLQARVIENMSEGVTVSNEAGTILYTNPAEDGMFGYEPGELVGKPLSIQNAAPPEQNESTVKDIVARVRERGIWSGELSNVKKDGASFVTSARVTGLDAGGKVYYVRVQEDITTQKHAENERDQLLEREQAARADAEAANRAKDEFLAMLGHELRNPLAPMVSALQLLRMKGRRTSDATSDTELDILERQTQHVVRLVDDLLEVSRITRGKVALNRQRLEVRAVVSKAVEIASPLLEERRHRVEVDVQHDLVVDGDEVRLSQVLANLLTNAAKFTEPGGRITVTAIEEQGEVVVKVRDNGAGIAPELLPHVFDLFTQGQRTLDRSLGGLGIGLTLVRNLVEAHAGTVTATSEGLGRGSEFSIRLPTPFDSTTEAPEPSTPPDARIHHPRRVLVVDDNEDAADMLAELLQTVGHEVRVAHDGPEALSMAPDFGPDVALLDIGLPTMDGYELATRLRQQSKARLIALTGYGQDHDRKRAHAAGFDLHLVKPIDCTQLLSAIDG